MSQKLIIEIYEAFADQLKLDYKKPLLDKNLQQITASLNKIDRTIDKLISSYEVDILSLSYLEKEMEMRIKFPDIWKIQLQEAKNSVASTKTQLIELGGKYKADIAQLFNIHENKKLSLDDIQKLI